MPDGPTRLHQLSGYPGRGLVVYRDGGGILSWAYFLTGRSEASRARTVTEQDGDLVVVPSAAVAAPDPLRHYVCATMVGDSDRLVLGNGDHVAQLASSLEHGTSLHNAMAGLLPEPDPPINTPRIAALVDHDDIFVVRVRETHRGRPARGAQRIVLAGDEGIVVHTYSGTPDAPIGAAPLFGFRSPAIHGVADLVWGSLNPDYRVLLVEGSSDSATPVRLLTDGLA